MSDYLEGDASKVVCNEIEEHLDGCEKCRMHVDTMKAVVTLFKGWRGGEIPKDVSGRLQNAVAGTVERVCRRSAGKSAGRGKSAARRAGAQDVKVKKKAGSTSTGRRKAEGKPRKKTSRKPGK